MAQLISGKFNVAWFKLAEFVNRKEKERALALCRLLIHSLTDKALIMQLEGDLLLAFKDEKSIEVYKRAAQLYEESGRFLQAALVYEHLANIAPTQIDVLEKMVHMYMTLSYEAKIARCSAQLIRLLLDRQEIDKANEILAQSSLNSRHKALLHEAFVINLLKSQEYVDPYVINQHIDGVIEGFLDDPEHKKITMFLSHLLVLNPEAYEYASGFLRQ